MKRSYRAMMLVFSAILVIVMGCRRGGEPQPPAEVQDEAKDYVYFSADDLAERIRPKKKMTVQLNQQVFPDELFHPLTEVTMPTPPDIEGGNEMVQKTTDDFNKAKDAYHKKREQAELVEFGNIYTNFAAKMPVGERSFDNLKKYVRRAKKKALRESLDKTTIHVVMEADFGIQGHYLAYRNESYDSEHAYIAVAPPKGPSPIALSYMKKDDLELKIKHQRFWLLHRMFNDFAKKTPINQRDPKTFTMFTKANVVPALHDKLMNRQIEFVLEADPKGIVTFDGANRPHVLAWLTTEDSPGHLALDVTGAVNYVDKDKKQVMLLDSVPRQQLWFAWQAFNQYVTTTQVERRAPQHDELKRYVKTNSLPTVNMLVDSGMLLLADPANPGPYTACFSRLEPNQTQYRAIAKGGQVSFITQAAMLAGFPKK